MSIHNKCFMKNNRNINNYEGCSKSSEAGVIYIRPATQLYQIKNTPKESSNAYTFVMAFSGKLKFRIKKYFGIHCDNVFQ